MKPIIYEPKVRAKEYSLLACNLYAGCVHGCEYCYVPAAVHIDKEVFHSKAAAKPQVLERLEADALHYQRTDQRVLLCFSCDPYPPEDQKGEDKRPLSELTRQALEILKAHQIPFQVLTKGGRRAARDFDLYGPEDAFATTLTLVDNEMSSCIEPGAESPASRIAAIRQAHNRGIHTWVSLEPVIDPGQSMECIKATHDFVDLYRIGKLNHRRNSFDWRRFGAEAIAFCEKYGVPYYVKEDLAAYLKGIEFHNTDTRIVKRAKRHRLENEKMSLFNL